MRTVMYRYLLMCCLLAITAGSQAASLKASVDRYRIAESETLNLTLTCDDAGINGQPDLSGLNSQFEVISSGSSSQTRIINGEKSSSRSWRFVLAPRQKGKLLIPSFRLQDLFSEPIEIEVTDASSSATNGAAPRGDLFIEASLNKKTAYVQEMITLTLKIYTSVQIARPKLDAPTPDGFMVQKIGESEFETQQDGRRYYVLQYQFALFPTRSGNLVIPRQRYQIAQVISNGPRSLFNIPGFDSQTQARFLQTADIPLHVKAAPAGLPVDYWLPADDVSISDNWPASQEVDAGTPLTRHIEIRALGNLAASVPALPQPNISGLKQYPEAPQLENSIAAENLLGRRVENSAIVGVKAGSYTLPEIRLHWWSNREQQIKVAVLPARQLTIRASAGQSAEHSRPDMAPPLASTGRPGPSADSEKNWATYGWIVLCFVLLLAWLATLALWWRERRAQATNNNAAHAAAVPSATQAQSLKDCRKQLKQACQRNDGHAARHLLLQWARLRWPQHPPLSLAELKSRAGSESLNRALDELDAALYRGDGKWQGAALAEWIDTGENSPGPGQGDTRLPTLYD